MTDQKKEKEPLSTIHKHFIKSKNKKESFSSSVKIENSDLEKTLIDIDSKNSATSREEADKKLNETLLIKTPIENEQTKLHQLIESHFPNKKEDASEEVETGFFPLSLEIENKIQESAQSNSEEKQKVEKKTKKEEKKFKNLMEKIFISSLLILLLDSLVESYIHSSPLFLLIFSLTIVSLLIFAVSHFKYKRVFLGTEIPLLLLMVLFCYSEKRYAGYSSSVFFLFLTPAEKLYNYVFLFSYFWIGYLLFRNNQMSKWLKSILLILIVYASLGFIENLQNGIYGHRIWNLKDTLAGSKAFQLIPHYYLKSVGFSLSLLPFLLLLFFIGWKFFQILKRNAFFLRNDFYIFTFLIFIFAFGNIILFNHHFPSFLSDRFLKRNETSVLGLANSETVKIATSKKTSSPADLTTRISAGLISIKDQQASVALLVRDLKNHSIAFLKNDDFVVIENQKEQKPIQTKFLGENGVVDKNLFIAIDRSSSMSSLIPLLEKSIIPLFDWMNSRENLFLIPFSENAQHIFIKDKKMLRNELERLYSYGTKNLLHPLQLVLNKINLLKENTIFLIVGIDSELSEKESNTLADQFFRYHVKLYLFSWGELNSSSRLRKFSEKTGGKYYNIEKEGDLAQRLLQSFIEIFGEYRMEFKVSSSTPNLKILSPVNKSLIDQNSFLVLKIVSTPVKISSARFYINDSLNQEVLVDEKSEVYFIIPTDQLKSGEHRLKSSVITTEGKEFFSEEVMITTIEKQKTSLKN